MLGPEERHPGRGKGVTEIRGVTISANEVTGLVLLSFYGGLCNFTEMLL